MFVLESNSWPTVSRLQQGEEITTCINLRLASNQGERSIACLKWKAQTIPLTAQSCGPRFVSTFIHSFIHSGYLYITVKGWTAVTTSILQLAQSAMFNETH